MLSGMPFGVGFMLIFMAYVPCSIDLILFQYLCLLDNPFSA